MSDSGKGESPQGDSGESLPRSGAVRYVIEPLSTRHAVASFRSGAAYLDWYLDTQARRLAAADVSRTFVLVFADAPSDGNVPDGVPIIGYFTLEAGIMPTAFLELPEIQRHAIAELLPGAAAVADGSDPLAIALKELPVVYLACLARDRQYHGKGYGGALLVAALREAAEAATHIGAAGIFLVATEEGARLYRDYGFVAFEDFPRKMFLPMPDVRAFCAALPNVNTV